MKLYVAIEKLESEKWNKENYIIRGIRKKLWKQKGCGMYTVYLDDNDRFARESAAKQVGKLTAGAILLPGKGRGNGYWFNTK